jgi:hypothetical protein
MTRHGDGACFETHEEPGTERLSLRSPRSARLEGRTGDGH